MRFVGFHYKVSNGIYPIKILIPGINYRFFNIREISGRVLFRNFIKQIELIKYYLEISMLACRCLNQFIEQVNALPEVLVSLTKCPNS